MTEPTLASQFLGLVTIITCLFIALLLIAIKEERAKEIKKQLEEQDRAIIEVYRQGRNQFNNIARENIRNCDRKFTFDEQAPVGLRPDLLALPQPKEQLK